MTKRQRNNALSYLRRTTCLHSGDIEAFVEDGWNPMLSNRKNRRRLSAMLHNHVRNIFV